MAKITYIQPNGVAMTVNVVAGSTLMEGAVQNGIEGVLAECGGNCACATCQVYIDAVWNAVVGPPASLEISMLQEPVEGMGVLRLSCQITVSDAVDGLVATVPASQH